MNRIIFTLFAAMLSVIAIAQGSVRGNVYDETTHEPLSFSNVQIMQDNKAIKTSTTDVEGAFAITNIPFGKYNIKVSHLGYSSESWQVVLDSVHHAVKFDTLTLVKTSEGTAVVTAQRSTMRLEVDRKSYNVDQTIANTGATADEVLENIPSVEVDQDGNISLRGNSSVEVWINGRASGLTSENRYEILQQLPAESIERVEVIDNPSAKFSAEGSAGIINIVLKKNRKAGYYGSVQVGGNTNGGANASGNINYSSSKFDAYLNLGYRHRHNNRGGSYSRQTYTDEDIFQNYDGKNQSRGNNLFTRAGITYHATPKDDITLAGMMMQGGHNRVNSTLYRYGTLSTGIENSNMFRRTATDGNMQMYHGELVFQHNFSETHFLSASAEYNRWMMNDEAVYQDSTTYADGITPSEYSYQLRPNLIRNRSMEFKIDYENQITDKFKLQTGYDARLSHENTPQSMEADYTDWNGAHLVMDENFFNRFIYSLDVHALYATASMQFGKLGVMAGLRGEYWKVNTESYNYEQEMDRTKRNPAFKKDFFQLFPSVFLNYQLSKADQIQLNYSRRLRRPFGGQLNNFKNTRDASIIDMGNPHLEPEYSNALSLNYLRTWELHSLSVSAYYRPTTNVMQRIQYRNNTDGLMYQTNENVSKSVSTGLEIVAKNKLFKILDLTTTANFYYFKMHGYNFLVEDQIVSGNGNENFCWNLRSMGSFTLPANFTLQLTADYRSRQSTAQGFRRSNFSFDAGLRKTFLNRKFTVALNCRDLFDTRKFRNVTVTDQFTRDQKFWRGGRNVNLTLTWNFGNMKQKPKKRQAQQQDDMDMNNGYDNGSEME